MKVDVPAGNYVVAVSGGVDSMVLLDIMRRDPSFKLVVAHFNHGIRPDSGDDENLVVSIAQKYNLPIEVGYGNLRANASEQQARERRYDFLRSVRTKYSADGIITAHHQGDIIETAFINILRGSGYRGLVSMQTNPDVVRPLLRFTKEDLIKYANNNHVLWREDISNQDEVYLRNYIRKNIAPALNKEKYQYLIKNIDKIADLFEEKENLIATLSQTILKNNNIIRNKYILLPYEIRYELIMYWLRNNKVTEFDKQVVEKLDIVLKTGAPGSRYDVKKGVELILEKKSAYFNLYT